MFLKPEGVMLVAVTVSLLLTGSSIKLLWMLTKFVSIQSSASSRWKRDFIGNESVLDENFINIYSFP